MDDDISLIEALDQALKPEAAKAAADPPGRLQEIRDKPQWKHGRQRQSAAGLGKPYVGSVGTLVISKDTFGGDVMRRPTRAQTSRDPREEGATGIITSIPSIHIRRTSHEDDDGITA
jgi:hypothetical protein